MDIDWGVLFFSLLLVDSIAAVVASWFGRGWYMRRMGPFADYFPPAKGWTAYYLVLVLIIGYLLGVFGG